MSRTPKIVPTMIGAWGTAAGYIPQDVHELRHDLKVQTPTWMIKIEADSVLTEDASTVTDFTDHAEVLGWSGASGRLTDGHVSGPLFTAGTLQHSDIWVKTLKGSFCNKVKNTMNKGVNCPSITIVRIAHIGDMRKIVDTHLFTNCKFQYFENQMDEAVFSFRFQEETVTTTDYSQSGEEKGNTVSHTLYDVVDSQDS